MWIRLVMSVGCVNIGSIARLVSLLGCVGLYPEAPRSDRAEIEPELTASRAKRADPHPSLNDLDNATLHIDGQSTMVDAPLYIIDVPDEDDDIIDDEDALPHDLADSDVEDLINIDDDGVEKMSSADVARSHGGDGGGDDRPPSHVVPTGCGGCFANKLNPEDVTARLEDIEVEIDTLYADTEDKELLISELQDSLAAAENEIALLQIRVADAEDRRTEDHD
ncbi:hypothetical protein Tco_1476526 [Tanacetum coccineum]